MLSNLSALLPSGVSLFDQGDRLLRLRFSERSGIDEDVLLSEEGISYRFTHGPDPSTSLSSDKRSGAESDTPLHTLILFDRNQQLPKSSEDPIRYHRTDGKLPPERA